MKYIRIYILLSVRKTISSQCQNDSLYNQFDFTQLVFLGNKLSPVKCVLFHHIKKTRQKELTANFCKMFEDLLGDNSKEDYKI